MNKNNHLNLITMKHKLIQLITMAISFLLISCGQEKEPVSVTGISLSPTLLEIIEGDIRTLSVNISPSNADNKSVSWTSTQPAVASVQEGTVTAHKEGTATIIVTTADGGKTATCTVNVAPSYVAVSEVSLNHSALELLEGESTTLTATISPEKATNKNVIWTSSDTSVIIVDNGKVTAIKEGTATITVTTEDGNKSATCEVTVLHDEYNDPIVFADEIMKEMCVSAFDTNGDGELSYKEASEVKSISKMTLTDKSFKSFNEFQYFTSVTSTPNSYFEGCSLMESITLPKETTSMGWNLFGSCKKLSSINIPEGVTVISPRTFEGCSGLSHVSIPQSVTEIGSNAFRGCSSLVSIDIPKGVKSIGVAVFWGCSSLKNVNLPEGLLIIESGLFESCSNLEEIYIPNSVNTIENDAFNGCKSLKTIDLPSKIMEIPSAAFADCSSLLSIVIPENVVTSYTMPNSVTTIKKYAFEGCSSLLSIVIPENVGTIGSSAFEGCSSLSSIYVRAGTPPTLTKDWLFNTAKQFDNNAPSRKIYVPIDVVDIYKTAEVWSEYADDIVGYDYENNRVVE